MYPLRIKPKDKTCTSQDERKSFLRYRRSNLEGEETEDESGGWVKNHKEIQQLHHS